MATARNAPCPCGSGKKYKKCCLGKMDPKAKRRMILIIALLTVVSIVSGVAVGWYTEPRNGLLAGFVGAVLIGIYLAVRNPPKSRGRTGADSINFGK